MPTIEHVQNFHNLILIVVMQNIETYNFTGDYVTVLGLIGVLSSAIIITTAFRRYYNSPLRK
jgi:hypothetical protein